MLRGRRGGPHPLKLKSTTVKSSTSRRKSGHVEQRVTLGEKHARAWLSVSCLLDCLPRGGCFRFPVVHLASRVSRTPHSPLRTLRLFSPNASPRLRPHHWVTPLISVPCLPPGPGPSGGLPSFTLTTPYGHASTPRCRLGSSKVVPCPQNVTLPGSSPPPPTGRVENPN